MSKLSIVQVMCSDDAVVIDTSDLKHCPRVLSHLLGIIDDFKSPEVDEFGRLTFAANLNIPRNRVLQCLTFLRTGYVNNVNELMETFNVLGGCDALDEYCRKQQEKAASKVEEDNKIVQLKQENPLCPKENLLGLFVFEPHNLTWVHGDEWDCTNVVEEAPHLFWWRKSAKK